MAVMGVTGANATQQANRVETNRNAEETTDKRAKEQEEEPTQETQKANAEAEDGTGGEIDVTA